MFRRSGGGRGRSKTAEASSTGKEVPVDGAVRVKKVERIHAYNVVSRPSAVYRATSPPPAAENLAVSVVRVGDVVAEDEAVRVRKVERIHAYNVVSRPSSVYRAASPAATAENLAVSVVRVGDVVVEGEHESFVSVPIA
ncbi:uncharacterized protein LOC100835223 [Brachypodium distachyon]|uniref:Uncharacterized protein n=1 Tax=Brachypodium distachyon TaxID=15368 RepID=I1HM26_BRADI|nr:uncharacterized protein LOC100835223 [Brachypodium distachyon]KQK07616.1 hypothetical protein BRADI_2g36580v3 [Brachypodium distachyon]|eukprot:XP_003568964.1 uncharacterized protein LOC100835223 [Brachypodium distachyon]